MENILLTINIVLAIILVILVLFQKSEGGALGIGVSQESYMFSKTAGNFLIRLPVGAYRGYGPTHSQSLESIFFHIPNLDLTFNKLTGKDKKDIKTAIKLGCNWIALSYLQNEKLILETRKLIKKR